VHSKSTRSNEPNNTTNNVDPQTLHPPTCVFDADNPVTDSTHVHLHPIQLQVQIQPPYLFVAFDVVPLNIVSMLVLNRRRQGWLLPLVLFAENKGI
jgi:hypothetical protein